MPAAVSFRCSLPVDHSIDVAGEELAQYLADRLNECGLPYRVTDTYEDCSWMIESPSPPRIPWLAVGYTGTSHDEWSMLIERNVRCLGYLLGISDAKERAELVKHLHPILRDDGHFSEIRWYPKEYSSTDWTSVPT